MSSIPPITIGTPRKISVGHELPEISVIRRPVDVTYIGLPHEMSDEDLEFLYRVLAERSPLINISHRKMPTYQEHVKFWKSNPYTHAWMIWYDAKRAGYTYLSRSNEIGIHILPEYQRKGLGKMALQLVLKELRRGERLLANIAPTNLPSQNFFESQGFRLIQLTYELSPSQQPS